MKIKVNQANFPVWKEITCKAKVPAKMKKLQLIAENLWWVWNSDATDLYKEIDEETWNDCGCSPTLFLKTINIEKLEAAEQNKLLLKQQEYSFFQVNLHDYLALLYFRLLPLI